MARLGIRTTAAAMGAAVLLVTGCSSGDGGDDLITIDPATAAVSPATTSTPDGVVHPYSGLIDSITFDPITRSAVLVADNPRSVLVVPADGLSGADPASTGRPITLNSDVRDVSIAADGNALLSMDRQVVKLKLTSGEQTSIPVDGQTNSAVELTDGRIAIGTDNGSVHIVDPKTDQSQKVSGFASVDELAVTGDNLSALDHRQTSLTAINLEDGKLGVALRAGEGATHLATDRFGRILVTDTTGNELLVFTADPLLMHQRYPVGESPYAVAYDETADRVWVTLTATNEVVGFDLSSGIPVETGRFKTVRQPNSLAVDSSNGNLIVGSATGDGLQVIPSREN
ncbi:YncE family protein [Rhodococcus sp. NPDC059969]|uniref:YncE family protein n=1 Tax=Rhodococcus sp. NPDC059969 TaxID=3347018 RepID=UPI00366BE36C